MKPAFVYPAVLFCALPLCAQSTGTSHPEQLDDTINAQTSQPYTGPAKPSPAVPMDPNAYPNGDVQNYQATPAPDSHYVKPRHHDFDDTTADGAPPVHQSVSSLPLNEQLADQPSGSSTYDRSGDPQLVRHDGYGPLPSQPARHDSFAVTEDPTSGVVMDVPTSPNELAQSTLLRAQLMTTLSTRTTRPGDHFTATLADNIVRHGQVLLPAGTTLHGRVSSAHSGHGVGTASVLRLEASSITLPDGTTYPLSAEVVDLRGVQGVHVTSEGTIKDNAMTRSQAAMLGGTTGGGAVAGALVGGGVGAAVGATIGAGVGTVLYLRRDREQTLPAHTELIFALNTPLNLTPNATASQY